jgi:hypothetical protein
VVDAARVSDCAPSRIDQHYLLGNSPRGLASAGAYPLPEASLSAVNHAANARTGLTISPPNKGPRGLVSIDKCYQIVELSYAFRNDDPEFRGQAAHGVRQHCLLFGQQRPSRMQGQDTLLVYCFGRHELSIGREAASQIAAASTASFFLPFFTNGLTASAAIDFTV